MCQGLFRCLSHNLRKFEKHLSCWRPQAINRWQDVTRRLLQIIWHPTFLEPDDGRWSRKFCCLKLGVHDLLRLPSKLVKGSRTVFAWRRTCSSSASIACLLSDSADHSRRLLELKLRSSAGRSISSDSSRRSTGRLAAGSASLERSMRRALAIARLVEPSSSVRACLASSTAAGSAIDSLSARLAGCEPPQASGRPFTTSQALCFPVHIEDEIYCRQRQAIPLGNRIPVFAPDTWIAPSAVVVGDVDLYDKVPPKLVSCPSYACAFDRGAAITLCPPGFHLVWDSPSR